PMLPHIPSASQLLFSMDVAVALPSGDRNICSSACLKTSGGREILITAALNAGEWEVKNGGRKRVREGETERERKGMGRRHVLSPPVL
ncbi:hypothetical protein AMECASPLE_037537, partial [Ameca splendens]